MGLFALLHAQVGVVLANLVSTSAGMAFSFVVNGLLTFGARSLSAGQAARFLLVNAAVLWALQPAIIGLLHLGGVPVVLGKVVAVAVCLGVNFVAYRYVVWPMRDAPDPDRDAVLS